MIKIVVLLMTILVIMNIVYAHKCIHDKIANSQQTMKEIANQRTVLKYSSNPLARGIQAKSNLRIKFVTKYTTLSTSNRNYLDTDVLPAAKKVLESMLLVTPVQGNLKLERSCSSGCNPNPPEKCTAYSTPTCGDYGTVEDTYFADAKKYPSCSLVATPTTVSGGPGVANTDIIIFVTDKTTNCDASTLAYAAHCFRDQVDRPVAGYINFCKVNQADKQSDIDTAVHEILHVLGVSSTLFAFFRDSSTGEPYSPRDSFGNPEISNGRYVISEKVVKDFTENGQTVTKIVAPEVVARGISYYGCSSFNGLELENFGGSGSAGSHIEGRTAYGELMTSTSTKNAQFSELTLSILEASSWYQVNYTAADPFQFGYRKGCPFVNGKCLSLSGGTTSGDYLTRWCKTSQKKGCTANLLGIGLCSVYEYTSSVPSAYRYFSDSTYGGLQYMDYCPVYEQSKACSSTAPSTNSRSEVYGTSSRCLVNTLNTGLFANTENGGCFTINCPTRTTKPAAYVDVTFANGKTVRCLDSDGGKSKSVEGLSGSVVCPDILDACPPLANSNCTCVNGNCVDNVCVCNSGFTGPTCASKSAATAITYSMNVLLLIVFFSAYYFY